MYSITIAGNLERCRTEAEISDATAAVVAVVYEQVDGWHAVVRDEHLNQADADFQSTVSLAMEMLSHDVNRRGENVADNPTRGTLALWLMRKDDGTAMGGI
ncbi:MAG: hypothetical protein WCE52_19775 [Candidatus Acidiferrum sp.]